MIEPVQIQVRFSDCDMMGHVNNAVYLSYFEYARVKYFARLLGDNRDWQKEGMILRTNKIEYLKPLFLKDEPVIHIYTENIGYKSFTLSYEVRVKGELTTTGESVLVCFDSTVQQSILIPEELKTALERLRKNKK